jgi:hypothetical protein
MKLEKTLTQQSYFYFIVFFLLVTAAFWMTYITRIFEQPNYRMHVHGATLGLWCVMLITQAFLIRNRKNQLHKRLGKFSYVLVPLILYTTLDLLRYQLAKVPELGPLDYHSVALVVNALVAFVILYGLAIYHRKRSGLHARYMVSTVFPFLTPATDRIIHIYFPSVVPYFYAIEGQPMVPIAGFLMADIIIVGLIIWDWRSHKRWNVFPFVLLILVTYHYSVLNFHRFQFWRSFSEWFVGQ